jgi:hypothetical protein
LGSSQPYVEGVSPLGLPSDVDVLIPPILEVYVVWHPADQDGSRIAQEIFEHFHGTTYSGLVGGAVEVYSRSAGWLADGGPPRPMPFMAPLPNGLASAAVTAVVPVLGTHFARVIQDGGPWLDYVQGMVAAADKSDRVGVFPLRVDSDATTGTVLGDLLGSPQSLDPLGATNKAVLCRDLSHSIGGLIGDPMGNRLQVFISHTKRYSPDEAPDEVSDLVHLVRDVIGSTHLTAFFDESDLQPGEDWDQRLREAAASSGMLVVRTDLYASREWCQREVLTAKRAGMPIVVLQALSQGEERGSFLLDHVPTVPLRGDTRELKRASIENALNQLVDEALKRGLWNQQQAQLVGFGFDWLPAHAPEPTTLTGWLTELRTASLTNSQIFILHPDPPLGRDEMVVIDDLFDLAGLNGSIEILTPRTFASRGGQVSP